MIVGAGVEPTKAAEQVATGDAGLMAVGLADAGVAGFAAKLGVLVRKKEEAALEAEKQ